MKPEVSIILTTCNRQIYLRQAIGSVLAQTFTNWELLVVDDWSTDGSFEMAYRFSKIDERIRVLETDLPPHGQIEICRYAHNINQAAKQAQGEFFGYLCDDDLYLPWHMEACIQKLKKSPEIDVVYDQAAVYGKADGEWKVLKKIGVCGITRQPRYNINHNSVIHRRHCFDEVRGWDEDAPNRYGDAYFFTRLATVWDFHPVMITGNLFRLGEQNLWTGKDDTPNIEMVEVGAQASAIHSGQSS